MTLFAHISPELYAIRDAIAASARRLHVGSNTGKGDDRSAVYREIATLRASAQSLSEIVDHMCRLSFPLPVTTPRRLILEYLNERDVEKDEVLGAMSAAMWGHAINEIDHVVSAGYVVDDQSGGRHILRITDTGKAALGGIIWARP